MTEHVKPPCIRDCTEPLYDQQTREKIGVRPKDAETGHLCRKCAGQLSTWLREIKDLYAMLDTRPQAVRRDYTQPIRRGKISGSPALARLDVITLQDWRTTTKAHHHEPGDEHAETESIPEFFISLANGIAKDDLKISKRVDTLNDAIDFLAGEWFTNICYLPWIADLHDIIKDRRKTLRRTNNITGARPLGKCHCGETIWEPEPSRTTKANPDGTIIECRGCGHRMNSAAIIRLAAAQRVQTGT